MKISFTFVLVAIALLILHFVGVTYSEEINQSTQGDKDDYYFEEEEMVDGEYGDDDRARWSYLPRFVENWCYEKCKAHGKPFARLEGVRCRCLCPINAIVLTLCPPTGGYTSCFDYCREIGYKKGGACLYNETCFCFCAKNQHYNSSIVYNTTRKPRALEENILQ